ncbi:MAG TPA: FAD binding domain-containing protein [Stellaceae bacterium]|nr:FAD binding domain-containing protein [Stellaceae bacterium]
MKPAAFEFHRPRDVDEALALLVRHGEAARLIAGGQSLVPMMNFRLATPNILIDLNGIDGLAFIRRDGDLVRIGAATRQQDVLESALVRTHAPLVAASIRHVGHYVTRCRGTIGGSLANADPASELVLAAITLGASLTLRGAAGTRSVAAQDFFLDTMTTALAPTEIVTDVAFPAAPEGTRVAFREHVRRHGDFAIASAAVQISPGDGRLRAGLGAVTPVPVACRRIEDAFDGDGLRADLDALVAAEIAAVEILADIRAGAGHRRRLAAVCLADCIGELLA